MSIPKPSAFRALVPANLDNPSCEDLKRVMVGLPKQLDLWWSGWFKDDGSISDEFKSQFCESSICGGTTAAPTTAAPTTAAPTTAAPPTAAPTTAAPTTAAPTTAAPDPDGPLDPVTGYPISWGSPDINPNPVRDPVPVVDGTTEAPSHPGLTRVPITVIFRSTSAYVIGTSVGCQAGFTQVVPNAALGITDCSEFVGADHMVCRSAIEQTFNMSLYQGSAAGLFIGMVKVLTAIDPSTGLRFQQDLWVYYDTLNKRHHMGLMFDNAWHPTPFTVQLGVGCSAASGFQNGYTIST